VITLVLSERMDLPCKVSYHQMLNFFPLPSGADMALVPRYSLSSDLTNKYKYLCVRVWVEKKSSGSETGSTQPREYN
jgi:hypothetical protein